MRLPFVAFLAFVVLLSGCAVVDSSKVDPSTVYSQYSASYSGDANQLKFDASFFVGGNTGTYLSLDGNSSVSVDNQAMSKDKTLFNQIIYEYQLSPSQQDLLQAHTFVYTDNSGNTYRNSVTLPAAISWVNGQSTNASIASGWTGAWQTTSSVGSSEYVTVSMQGQSGSVVLHGSNSGTSGQVSATPTDLQSLGTGTAKVSLCRGSSNDSIQGSAAGGELNVSYCAPTLSVTITQ